MPFATTTSATCRFDHDPTLAIGGKADRATPIEQARRLHAQIETSRLVALPAAHLSKPDRDTEFTAALGRFLVDQSA